MNNINSILLLQDEYLKVDILYRSLHKDIIAKYLVVTGKEKELFDLLLVERYIFRTYYSLLTHFGCIEGYTDEINLKIRNSLASNIPCLNYVVFVNFLNSHKKLINKVQQFL